MLKLDKNDVEEIVALTPLQEGILFHYLKDPDTDAYHEQLSIELTGELHFTLFEKAWNLVVESNEMLRTTFRWRKVSHPVQIVLKKQPVAVEYYNFSNDPRMEEEIEQLLFDDKMHKFDLQERPFRLKLCTRSQDKHVLIVSNHHIICDGWSTGNLLRQFLVSYECLIRNEQPPRFAVSKFSDFVRMLKDKDQKVLQAYWKKYLDQAEPAKQIVVEGRNEEKDSSCIISMDASPGMFQKINEFLRVNEATLASLLYSAWAILLERYTGTKDVIMGTTVSGRNYELPGIENMVGLFISTIPLRVQIDGEGTALELVRRVGRDVRSNQDHSSLSLTDITDQSGLSTSDELFKSIVVIENYPLDSALFNSNGPLRVNVYTIDEKNNYDLSLSVFAADRLQLQLHYQPRNLNEAAAQRLLNHLMGIIEQIVYFPSRSLKQIRTLPANEEYEAIYSYNRMEHHSTAQETIHQLIEKQVIKTPDRVALECGEQALTYHELNKKVNQLAWSLRKMGVKEESLVGIMVNCSMEMVIGSLAILKAGGAYLPIDPSYPLDRKEYIVRDSGIELLLTVSPLNETTSLPCSMICIEDEQWYAGEASNPRTSVVPGNLAYCIYTSGTTGNPKGVLLEHRNIVGYLKWAAKTYVKNENSNFPLYSSLGFDLTVTSLFTPLITGHTVIVYNGDNKGQLLEQIIDENKVGVVKLTPSHLKLIRNKVIRDSNIKIFIVGGEDLETALAEQISRNCNHEIEIMNEYGPTEATVGCMTHSYNPKLSEGLTVPIGMPADGVSLYILDRYLQPVPAGVVGELYISGGHIARGYLNKLDLTGERFIRNPYYTETAEGNHAPLMYKTGDLAVMADGKKMIFKGRVDNQVKINGYRIELGEIENQLLRYKAVTGCLVVDEKDQEGQRFLVVYYEAQEELSVEKLRKHLTAYLPAYMIPARYMWLQKLPLNEHGKANKALLPRFGEYVVHPHLEYVLPATEIQKQIAEAWEEVLGGVRVGLHDRFFEIGGNSLNAIRLASRLESIAGKEVPVTAIFQHPTVAELAAHFVQGQPKVRDEHDEGERQSEGTLEESDIAIIGMSGRFPGAGNVEEYWENLKNGIESISFFTDTELLENGVEPDLLKNPNYIRAKGIVENVQCFDAPFFNYSLTDAKIMDPQLKVLHECAWEGLEDAGYAPERIKESVGVYVGATTNIHWLKQLSESMGGSLSEQFEVGALNDMYSLSTRLAFKLNLKGPALSLHTACSTSAVAVHLACQALLNGECDLALAGGASIIVPIKTGYLYQKGMVKSADGHCRAFDAEASGVVGGDGAGIIVLKPLLQAKADRDNIHAVIKGSAINNDGNRKVGYSAPSVKGQADVIRAAYKAAGVSPSSISYVEAHGTGTLLGDPIEIEALADVFGPVHSGRCAIGSVKTNIGHLDAAAGIAGIIKTALALKNKSIPASLHYKSPNPHINFSHSPFYVNSTLSEWVSGDQPRRAGVSSFGIGGTNCHLVLQEASDVEQPSPDSHSWKVFPLSAQTPTALDTMTENLAQFLQSNLSLDLSDVAYTLQVGRRSFPYRRMFVCNDAAEACSALTPVSGTSEYRDYDQRKLHSSFAGKMAKKKIFMFPGHGAEYLNMGRELYEQEPAFRKHLDRCFELVSLMATDVRSVLYPESDLIDQAEQLLKRTELAQPILFSFEYALSRMLAEWGVEPDMMIGYSLGEYAAACYSGVFSLEDTIRLLLCRGRLMQQVPKGAMLSIPLPEEAVIPLLSDGLSLSVDNGTSCIIAGTEEAIANFELTMKQNKQMCTRINIAHAGHSAMMDGILQSYEAELRAVKLNRPAVPFVSTVTGTWITDGEATDIKYWVKQMRETVRFAKGIQELASDSDRVFIEVGPGQDLSLLVHRFLDGSRQQYAVNVIRPSHIVRSDVHYLLNKLGRLWLSGIDIDWGALEANQNRRRLSLPTYPFEREFYGEITSLPQSSAVSVKGGKKEAVTDWFYAPAWRESILPASSAAASLADCSWLVFADECGLGEMIVSQLEQAGGKVFLVKQGTAFNLLSSNAAEIHPAVLEDYEKLFATDFLAEDKGFKVIHMWGVTGKPSNQHHDDWIEYIQDIGLYSLLYLTQAAAQKSTAQLPVWVVTDHMQNVAGEALLYPEKATVLGACLTISQEYPHMKCRNIDVSGEYAGGWEQERLVRQIMNELKQDEAEVSIAYRNHRRWLQRYERTPLPAQILEHKGLRKEGVYVIIGGLGHIGTTLAQHLAETVQARLVLIGRSLFPERKYWEQWLSDHAVDDPVSGQIKKVLQMEETGAIVQIISADAADEEKMIEAFSKAKKSFGTIHGVIYAAGVTGKDSFSTIAMTDVSYCREHFRPKMHGVIVLESVLKGMELDFCILTSSLSPILGGIGFFAYSAASHFLDAYVRKHNKGHKQQWLCLNLDGWNMPMNEGDSAMGSTLANLLISPQEGRVVFSRVFPQAELGQIIVSTGDLQDRIDKWVNFKFVSRSLPEYPLQSSRHFLSVEYVPPRHRTDELITEIYRSFFALEQIGIEEDFFELGGDSLKAISLVTRIQQETGYVLPVADFFKHSTPRKISDYIMSAGDMAGFRIYPAEQKAHYPLSSAQKRLYVMHELEPEGVAYNETTAYRIHMELDIARVQQIFQKLIDRHESFRTSFHLMNDEVVQKIHEELQFTLEYAEVNEEGAAQRISDFIRPFDLTQAPLFRAGVFKVAALSYILIVDLHHIIADAISFDHVIRDFFDFYVNKEPVTLGLQYKDYCEWLNSPEQVQRIHEQGRYWIEQFADNIPVLHLNTDFPRPLIGNSQGGAITFAIGQEMTEQLQSLASEQKTTLYTLLLSVYALLLARHSGQEDFVIGSPVSGRPNVELNPIVGMFVNMLPIRSYPRRDMTYVEFLMEMKESVLKSLENQEYPFDDLVRTLDIRRNLARHPIFDVVFSLQHLAEEMTGAEDLHVELYPIDKNRSPFDLILTATESDNGIHMQLEYSSGLFTPGSANKLAAHYLELIGTIIEDPGKTIGEITAQPDILLASGGISSGEYTGFDF
ncbi:non-ribosomal peptide synthetase/type I polyketide synthase [Paenibacillus sp. FSL R7-0337]|uniref:non-ribosomal peptide synthetase/type I polyketide synthase n=1 Tax=Paenibacillus sp. FSL R7-0337 TaxID=1926588 RepID=UPI0015C36C39|nr:non-ribosomal peptide synthetase/type I polyketide synthase [Paenibacillus sp. FSL R7-0337]